MSKTNADPMLGIRLSPERKARIEEYAEARDESVTAVITRCVRMLTRDYPEVPQAELDAALQAAYAAAVSGGNMVQAVLTLYREQGFRSPLLLLLRLTMVHLDYQDILYHYAQLGTAGGRGLSQTERAWQDKLNREPEHVRLAAEVLTELSDQFLARLRVDAGEGGYPLGRVSWWIDPRVLKAATPETKTLRQLIAAGYLVEDDQSRDGELLWVSSV